MSKVAPAFGNGEAVEEKADEAIEVEGTPTPMDEEGQSVPVKAKRAEPLASTSTRRTTYDPTRLTTVDKQGQSVSIQTNWFDKETWIIMSIGAVLTSLVTVLVAHQNNAWGNYAGWFFSNPLTAFGASIFIYHGVLDGPTRSSETGDHLPTWNFWLRSQLCSVLIIANTAFFIYTHQNEYMFKAMTAASCAITIPLLIGCGLWFITPILYVPVLWFICHFTWVACHYISREMPIMIPWLVLMVDVFCQPAIAWGHRISLDTHDICAPWFWGTCLIGLESGFRKFAFVGIMIGQPRYYSWWMIMFFILSNVATTSMMSTTFKEVMYEKMMGWEVDMYDINGRNMVACVTWASDVRFLVILPLMLLWGESLGFQPPIGSVYWTGLKENFGLVYGLYVLQLVLVEAGSITVQRWCDKQVTTKGSAGGAAVPESEKVKVISKIGAAEDEPLKPATTTEAAEVTEHHEGRYFYGEGLKVLASYHPYIPWALEFTVDRWMVNGLIDLLEL